MDPGMAQGIRIVSRAISPHIAAACTLAGDVSVAFVNMLSCNHVTLSCEDVRECYNCTCIRLVHSLHITDLVLVLLHTPGAV